MTHTGGTEDEHQGRGEDRRILLTRALMLPVVITIVIGTGIRFYLARETAFEMVAALLFAGIALALSRTNHALFARLFVLFALCPPCMSIFYRPQHGDETSAIDHLIWLTVPMIYGAMAFPIRWSIVATSALFLSVFFVPMSSDWVTWSDLSSPASFLSVILFFSIIASVVLHRSQQAAARHLDERRQAEEKLMAVKENLEERVQERTLELERTAKRLGALLESTPAAVIMLDSSMRVMLWNSAAERLFGWSAEEVINESNPVSLHGTDKKGEGFFGLGLGHESQLGLELTVATASGDPLEVSASASLVSDASGDSIGVVGVFQDLTARRELESQLLHAQKMEAVGHLAGGVAHDFNNILTIINGFSEMMLRYGDQKGRIRKALENIHSAGIRGATLTRQLLAFSGKQESRKQVIYLNELIEGMTKLLRRVLSVEITLELDLEPELWYVEADPGQIEQIIMNLVVNARDAMPLGGTLTIATRNISVDPTQSGSGWGPLNQVRRAVVMRVSDTGVGIDPEAGEHLFEPFFTTKPQGKGTGLGLSTVYGIVSQTGGIIDFDTELGQGTTFNVLLPSTELGARSLTPIPTSVLTRGHERVLVVEDEEELRLLVVGALEDLGYHVETAADGKEAIQVFREAQDAFELILSDVALPYLSGPEVIRQIMQDNEHVKVLFMSGYPTQNSFKGVPLVADIPLLQKPFTLEELADSVRQALDSETTTLADKCRPDESVSDSRVKGIR